MKAVVFVPSVPETAWAREALPWLSPAELPVAGRRWIDCVVEWAVARGYQMVEVVDWFWSESVAADFADLTAHAVPVFYQRGEGPLPTSADDIRRLDVFYREMVRYAFHMPNSGSLSSMLEYCLSIIERFIEVPGGLTFEEVALQCLAALHPPTYVHSMMVAKLATCMCGHLIDRNPEQLVGAPGYCCVADVLKNREALLDYTFHAARCHDVGKLSIIDTIFVYGRNLFDTEFEIIRTHPRTGWQMLKRYPSTRDYRDIALGHHRWYDNSRGYPDDFDTSRSPVKPIIDIVLCADCLDAATDSVGRSYRRGKTLEDFIAEVLPECGAHYPPWLAELLKEPETAQGLWDILQEGRRETYQNTYGLLSQMNEA